MQIKQNLASALGIQKENGGGGGGEGTMHFSEITKLQYGKKCHILLCIYCLFGLLLLNN